MNCLSLILKNIIQKDMMRTVRLFLLSFVVLAASCAVPAVKTTMLVPAKYHEASRLREVAVLPFDGSGGQEFAAEIEGTIAGINIGDKQYFNLVDRVRLEKLISEMKLSRSALVDSNTAARVGRLVGAKGIYTGTITASDVSDSAYREERKRCAQTVTKHNKKGIAYEECVKYETYTVPCTKRTAIFAFTPRLVEVETGKVVYSSNIGKSVESSACSDSRKPLPGGRELIEQAKQHGKEMFRTDIAPYYVTVEIELMDSDDGIISDTAKVKLAQGTDFAKKGRLDRACELWGEARILAPNALSVLYNLGICSEVTGELEQALDLYRKVDKLLSKPDDKVNAALARVQKRLQEQKKLKEQILN